MKVILPEDSHCMTCEKDTCPVCHSKLVELKQYWQYMWFIIQTNSEGLENARLDEYE